MRCGFMSVRIRITSRKNVAYEVLLACLVEDDHTWGCLLQNILGRIRLTESMRLPFGGI
jgi:hypothetical protein